MLNKFITDTSPGIACLLFIFTKYVDNHERHDILGVYKNRHAWIIDIRGTYLWMCKTYIWFCYG